MKRLASLAAILAVLAPLSANSAPRGVQLDLEAMKTMQGATIKADGKCWANIDSSRGFGYWDTCDPSVPYPRALSRRGLNELEASGDGGGGSGGGGGNR